LNRDLSVRAKDTLPFTPKNVKEWKQNPRRLDLEGVDTPIRVMKTTPPHKANHAKETVKIDEFYQNYPEDKIIIPLEWSSTDAELRLMDSAVYYQKKGTNKHKTMPLDWYVSEVGGGHGLTKNEALKTAKALEKKGYVKITTKEPFDEVLIEVLPGGFAKLTADKKGKYADILYGELNKRKGHVVGEVKLSREKNIEATNELIKRKNALLAATVSTKKAKSLKREITKLEKYSKLLKNDDVELVGNKRLASDIRFVLKNYFDISPKILENNVLYVGYSNSPLYAGMCRHNGLSFPTQEGIKTVDLYDVKINNMFKDSDVKSDEVYLSTLIHELTHWQRLVDARRDNTDVTFRFADRDDEEKKTTMETTIRMGDKAPSNSGYYRFIKNPLIEQRGVQDNKLLTVSPVPVSDKRLHQVVEDIVVRKNTSLINRIKLVGRREWVDTFYQKEGAHYQFYTPNPSKTFNPKRIAREIDREDGVSGNENVYEWRDGKKYKIVSKN
jgi:hypothetical protein